MSGVVREARTPEEPFARARFMPKHRMVEEELAARIQRGEYGPGDMLPSQRDLSASFGVTLMTLRQALRALSDRGLVQQQPGRGTFVTPPPAAYRLESLRSLADELRSQGLEVTTRVRRAQTRAIPARVSASLGVEPGSRGLRLERVRCVNGRPIVHQLSWVPEPYAPHIAKTDFTVTPLYAALALQCQVAIAAANETIRPALLQAALAEVLGRRAGTPVFVSERVTFGIDRVAVVFDQATIDGQRMQISTGRVANSVSLAWGLRG
ncbi:GntR family transcriptional regulator [Actinoplanes sp. NPDC023801]|uniref:GntR family transcriptional regulator n=1 Tax=Actinoplanes sp. NPDC023801 TaxID=3154595 RepID=UPI0033E6AE05